jgi:hypothetical protein
MASQISTSGLEDLRSLLDVFDYVMPDVVPATAVEAAHLAEVCRIARLASSCSTFFLYEYHMVKPRL